MVEKTRKIANTLNLLALKGALKKSIILAPSLKRYAKL